MLETATERVKLMRSGIETRTIEKLYIIYNNFKIVFTPVIFEIVEINVESNSFVEAIEKFFHKQNSFIEFPHLVKVSGMFKVPKFIYGFSAFPKMIPGRCCG